MKILTCVAALMLTSTAAQAEIFNGGYVGAQVGWEKNSVDSAVLFKDAGLGTVTQDKKSVSGATIGLNIGYDYKVSSQFVIGGEFAGSISTSTNKQLLRFSTLATPLAIEYKSRATFEITARAGLLASENTLVYLRAGYANSKLKATFTGTVNDPFKGNNNGFLIGGGVQQALSDKISARMEYRYFDLKGPVSRHQFVAGVAYHF